VEDRAASTIESDIATITSFASSYRAYWGVAADGSEREPVKDRVGLRARLHRQLPRVERIMVRANTNGFGFGPPPIAGGGPPRLGVVAVAFADEDPVYAVGGGPPCYDEVINRLEMTIGVLEDELEVAREAAPTEKREVDGPTDSDDAKTQHSPVPVEVVESMPTHAASWRVFLNGIRTAWYEARAARSRKHRSLEAWIAIAAGLVTIVGTVGAILGWWSL
jgi:hypothetical protein